MRSRLGIYSSRPNHTQGCGRKIGAVTVRTPLGTGGLAGYDSADPAANHPTDAEETSV